MSESPSPSIPLDLASEAAVAIALASAVVRVELAGKDLDTVRRIRDEIEARCADC